MADNTEEPKYKCANCSEPIKDGETHTTPSNEDYCESCFSDNCTICYQCSSTIWQDDSESFNYDTYCSTCINEVSFWCNSCDSRYSTDESHYCEECGEDMCENCYDNDDCRGGEDSECSEEFQEGKYSRLMPIKRFVGVEIEAEHGYRRELSLPYSFGVVSDGSLDSDGVEVVTPPATGQKLIDNIELACRELKNARFEATDHCGLHVHIDLRDIRSNFIKLSRVLRTFYAIEDVIFAMLPDSRLDNHYCEPLRRDYQFYDFYGAKISKGFDSKLYKCDDKQALDHWKKERYNGNRYHSANFHSVFYRGSLEIRAHSGTTDSRKILNWIAILLKIVTWSINKYDHATVEELLNMPNSKKKVSRMRRIFKFPRRIEKYINYRINKFGNENLTMNYTMGDTPKGKVRVKK